METEAQMLCQQYRSAMEKIGENEDQREVYRRKIQELESSVIVSAKRLCCKILQYEGKVSLTLINISNYNFYTCFQKIF